MMENKLRDEFAAAALTGLVAHGFILIKNLNPEEGHKELAECAFKIADAMLEVKKATEKKPQAGAL